MRRPYWLGDPVWEVLAAFVRAHAVVGLRAQERGLLIAERGAEELVPDGGAGGQVYGMLHPCAALQSAVTGSTDGARAHLAEAAEVAGRTGDSTFAGLYFGPHNVGVWRVALALELGEPGRVAELAREVDVDAIPSAGRQASFYGDVGRGLATVRGRETDAVQALRRVRFDNGIWRTMTANDVTVVAAPGTAHQPEGTAGPATGRCDGRHPDRGSVDEAWRSHPRCSDLAGDPCEFPMIAAGTGT